MIVVCLAVVGVLVAAQALRPRARRAPAAAHEPPPRARTVQSAWRRFTSVQGAVHRSRLARREPSPGAIARWCDELSRRVRGGSSLVDAIVRTIPDDPRLAEVTDGIRLRLERGVNLDTALAAIDAPVGRRGNRRHRAVGVHLQLALSVIGAAATHGGHIAQVLDRVAAALRLRAADEHERAAQSAQARLSAHVLTALPVGFLVLLVLADRAVRDVIASPIGISMVALGGVLDALGWLWMRSIVGGRR